MFFPMERRSRPPAEPYRSLLQTFRANISSTTEPVRDSTYN